MNVKKALEEKRFNNGTQFNVNDLPKGNWKPWGIDIKI